MKNSSILLLIVLILSSSFLAAQTNPFTGKNSKADETATVLQKSTIWHKITQWQKEMNNKLNRLLKNLKESFQIKYFCILMLISFVFGIIHAIGPGHGKMIVGAYFLKEKANSLKAVKIGFTVAVTHSGLAVILGIIFGFLLRSLKMHGRQEIQNYVTIAGGILITLLGLYYLWQKGKTHSHQHQISSQKNDLLVGVFSGLVPCPISMTIILFSIYMDVFLYGFLSVVFFSIGMAATISLLGLAAIKSRDLISRIPIHNLDKLKVLQRIFGIITSLLIVLIGVNIVVTNLS